MSNALVPRAKGGARRPFPLGVYVAMGLGLGLAYAAANTAFDILDRKTPLVATLAAVHAFVDRGVPLLAGALLGVTLHYFRLRTELAREAEVRAEALGRRLEHTERDQAVWLVATATLHEVKNPLHALGLLLDEVTLLEEGGEAPEGSPSRPELLEKARAHMKRIDASIGSLRDVAGHLTPKLQDVDLYRIVEDVARDAEVVARGGRIELEVPSDVRAKGDHAWVRIIVENLVQNGLEAALESVSPRVCVTAERQGDRAVVRVLDNGKGFDAHDRAALFEPLSTRKSGGMGLGLSVSRALARAMQGDVVLTEAEGFTTCVELRLPR
jgi:signal transduction histidine kinase